MKYKKLFLYIFITILIGGLFSFLTFNNEVYKSLIKPPLTPPMFLFPIVWTVIFILIAFSLYFISENNSDLVSKGFIVYFIQLIFNSLWTLFFFGLHLRLFSFIWLVLLLILVIYMTVIFYKIDKKTIYFLLPYIAWLLFAGYLNFGLYILNM